MSATITAGRLLALGIQPPAGARRMLAEHLIEGDWVFDADGWQHPLTKVRPLKNGSISTRRNDHRHTEHWRPSDELFIIRPKTISATPEEAPVSTTKYEITVQDDFVEQLVNDLRNGRAWSGALADQIDVQRPGLPIPTNFQAVVRTTKGIATLADPNSGSLPWYLSRSEDGGYGWEEPDDIGKVLEVIHPGKEA